MKKYAFLFMFFVGLVFTQNLPLNDNFSENTLSNWEQIDNEPAYSGPGKWLIEDGVLRQTSNIWAYQAPDEFKYHLGTNLITGNEKWDNYSLNVICRATDNDGIGIIFRYVDKNNYYRFYLMDDNSNGGPVQRLQKYINGEPYTIYEEKPSSAIPKGWFSLTADLRDDSIKVYLNGELFASQRDTRFIEGRIGLACYAMSGAYFDSVTVSEEKIVYQKPAEVFTERSPYIQLPDTNSVIIAWRSKQKSLGRVTYGLTKELNNSAVEDSSDNKHAVHLNNLKPDTKYYYRVWNDTQQFNELDSFYTMPSENKEEISFLLWGDSGTGNEAQMKIADLLNKEKADFAVHVGDVSQSDGSEYDEIFFKPYKNIVNKMNIYTCIGNHDVYYDEAKTYLGDFYLPSNNSEKTERYYSFRWGKSYFIVIDSNIDYQPGSAQYQFIENALLSEKCQSVDWVFVSFHHPPYCELWDAYDGETSVREYLLPLFESHKVDMVLNGHTHGYEKGRLNDVYYIISGGGGGGLDNYGRDWPHITKSLAKHHYCKVKIAGARLDFTAIDIDGNIIDNFTIQKDLTSIEETENTNSDKFKVEQNYPNPFNPKTVIPFVIPSSNNLNSKVSFEVHNLLGEKIFSRDLGYLEAGEHKIDFDAEGLSSGIYIYSLRYGNKKSSLKMIHTK